LIVCDTTLRDGEQAPGVAFTIEEKVAIATLLDKVGIQEIECGTPAMGNEERDAVAGIARLGLSARVMAWNRAVIEDIEASIRCGVSAVAVSLPASEFQIRHKLGKSRIWVIEQLRRSIDFAKAEGLYVCMGAEDASRADLDFLVQFARAAEEAGADRLRFSDTLGLLEPLETYRRLTHLVALVRIPIEIHAHNDFGMATANALAGFQAGASVVSTTVLGLGERSGNAALEEVIMAARHVYGHPYRFDLSLIPALCASVAAASGRSIPEGKPIVGQRVFSHESGIHVDGVLKNPANYEPFPPEELGRSREILLGKHSGRNALAHRLSALGVAGPGARVDELLPKIRARGMSLKRPVSALDLALLTENLPVPGQVDVPG